MTKALTTENQPGAEPPRVGAVGAAEDQVTGSPPNPQVLITAAEAGSIGPLDDPLAAAVCQTAVLNPEQFGGNAAHVNAGIIRHYVQANAALKDQCRVYEEKLNTAQERISDLRESNATLQGKLNALDKPWMERLCNISGGGLMGASFVIWPTNGGLAVFIFGLGLILTSAKVMPLLGDWIAKRLGG